MAVAPISGHAVGLAVPTRPADSLSAADAFQRALSDAQAAVSRGGPDLKGVMTALDGLNGEADQLAAAAQAAQASGQGLDPGEMIMLTMRCNEFMFHCELTSNMANRSSDGLQQLFREQS